MYYAKQWSLIKGDPSLKNKRYKERYAAHWLQHKWLIIANKWCHIRGYSKVSTRIIFGSALASQTWKVRPLKSWSLSTGFLRWSIIIRLTCQRETTWKFVLLCCDLIMVYDCQNGMRCTYSNECWNYNWKLRIFILQIATHHSSIILLGQRGLISLGYNQAWPFVAQPTKVSGLS